MTPLITVITLSYNNDSTILRAIDSVLCQSYPKIQYIVSDDCSESFDSKSIHDYIQKNNKGNIVELLVLKNTVNKGISKNLNTAVSYANGQYLSTSRRTTSFMTTESWKNGRANSKPRARRSSQP